jgi:cellobiose-specific phosphotransferase system component IIC
MSRNKSSGGGLGAVIGVLFVIGLIIKFIWWIVGALALVAVCYVIRAVVRQANAAATARNQRMAAIAARADQQHNWVMQGDDRGTYGPDGAPLMRFILEAESRKISNP